jgi:hypothetical protein
MLDIETLGREPGCAIVSVGAVKFGPEGLGETFYRSVSLSSCDARGLDVDIETLEWWLDQSDAAREQLSGGTQLPLVFQQFNEFYGDADEVWANSPSFDCEIMEAAYAATPLDEPWEYDEERDHRTLRELPQAPSHDEMDDIGTEHNALDDAVYQATQAHRTLDALGYYE